MKMKSNIFFKLFGLMVFGFLVVFVIQYLAKVLFFDQMYISQIHTRNIESMNEVRDRVNEGDDLFFVLYDEGVTDINAYITDQEFEVIEDEFDYEDGLELEDIELGTNEFSEKNGVFYQVIEDPMMNAYYTFYYAELDDGNYLVFEHYLYGLMTANDVLNSIDLYIIIGMIIFLIPYTYWYSRKFSKPLVAMNKQVTALSNLEFLAPLEVTSNDEIGELTESINKVSKSLEESISKLKEDIEFEKYKDKKRRELIASLSHELKTPITTLRAVIEGMSDNIGKYANRDTYLKESLEYLHYMETLSKDLIDAINIESKTIYEDSYFIKEIYNQSLRFVTENIQKRNQTLLCELDNVKVQVNKEMIQRVFINLLNNASKYSSESETITITSKIINHDIEISILNSGAYIKPGDITHLFEPFYRVEKSRNKDTGGSGLGLFIIKSILDGHDSKYSIENTVEGVEFKFTLKVTQ